MITVGIVLALAGSFMLTQNTATRFGAPLVIAGAILIAVKLLS
jgi:hypothetical protein